MTCVPVRIKARFAVTPGGSGAHYRYEAVYAGKLFGFEFAAQWFQPRSVVAAALRALRAEVRKSARRHMNARGFH